MQSMMLLLMWIVQALADAEVSILDWKIVKDILPLGGKHRGG
jgi:hypothetical protein